MAEAVEALCTWTLQQEGVRHITAETDADGFASQRLLLKCGFREHSRAETCRWIR
ncbi:GNAT family N-acetyltransferase [Alistipes sp. kh20]|nr:GNAT family N-acetyltransferase [Alistipes montrealensis]